MLVVEEVHDVFTDKRSQDIFVEIYGSTIKQGYIKEICVQEIQNLIKTYKTIDIERIIDWLDPADCAFLFAYIVLYYSIYKFRFEWTYINVKVLNALWNRHKSRKYDTEVVINKIENSDIGHRFNRSMFDHLYEYIDAGLKMGSLNRISNDNVLDLFYMWVVQTCVTNQDNSIRMVYYDHYDMNILATIIYGLSRHRELMGNENVQKWVNYFKAIFSTLDHFPKEMEDEISLNSLLLTDMDEKVVARYAIEYNKKYNTAFGKYLLVKIRGISDDLEIKRLIIYAFYNSNLNIEEYVGMIENECNACNYLIDHDQIEKLRWYLEDFFNVNFFDA